MAAEPGAGGYKDLLHGDYDNDNVRTDINSEAFQYEAKLVPIPQSTKYQQPPDMPFKEGPIALIKKYGGNPLTDLPPYDPFDELTSEKELNAKQQYVQELKSLKSLQFHNELQNIRSLIRTQSLVEAQKELKSTNKIKGVFIGDRVVRGPDWKWGEQDIGCPGTVRGIRRWHPAEALNAVTEVVVLWDHGLYGNYRFNYRGAYDVKVIERVNHKSLQMEPIAVGDTVCRKQQNWRWGDQDGGVVSNSYPHSSYTGTIVELYASPAPFEGGARIGVCWDKDRADWQKKANTFRARKMLEEKENGGMMDLNLEEFDYATHSDSDDDDDDDDDDNNNFIAADKSQPGGNNDHDDEKQIDDDSEFPHIPEIPNPLSKKGGKGAILVTCGIETDDPWSMGDDYKEWECDNLAQWIRNLNHKIEEFDEYADKVLEEELCGNDFEKMREMHFWMERVDVDNEDHAKALAAAVAHRMDEYEKHKDDPFYAEQVDADKATSDNVGQRGPGHVDDDEKEQNTEEEAPVPFGADFAFDIPEMDKSMLSPHLSHDVGHSEPGNVGMHDNMDEGEGGGHGISDEDDDDDEADTLTNSAAAAAYIAAPATDSVVGPGAPGQELETGSCSGIKKNKGKNGGKGRKLHFWDKVMRKEEKIQKLFAIKRPIKEYWHNTRGCIGGMAKQQEADNQDDEDGEDEYEWTEPTFEELLSKPIAKYRWGIQYNYDLEIREKKEYSSSKEYLMIDDRVCPGKDFTVDERVGAYKSDQGIVLKIEQWDDTRLEPSQVRGDKIFLTWSSHRSFRFNYKGAYDIEFAKRGQVFAMEYSHIRVGDRVVRGFSWTDDMYHAEDGGPNSLGTVTCVQYVLQVTGILAKVLWHRNNHINMYSWGFKNKFDLRRVD